MTNEQTSDPHVVVILTTEQAGQVAGGTIGSTIDETRGSTIGTTIGGTHACCSGQLNGFQNLLGALKSA